MNKIVQGLKMEIELIKNMGNLKIKTLQTL